MLFFINVKALHPEYTLIQT